MKCTGRLWLEFESSRRAEAVAGAIVPDDDAYIRTTRRGRMIRAQAIADNPMSLLHTLDDYLACVSVAERAGTEARPRKAARPRRA